jgi:hypothetical protein
VISLLFVFISTILFAQLDTEHWFAPMSTRAGTGSLQSYLYLSTNETTPFNVGVYNDNQLISTVQISKGNPQKVFIPGEYMITSYQGDLFTPNGMGLHVKGSKSFMPITGFR